MCHDDNAAGRPWNLNPEQQAAADLRAKAEARALAERRNAADRAARRARRICLCDPTTGASCSACDGTEAARKENRANRDEAERQEVRWWLQTCARLPEGYRPRLVDFPAPREDLA
jgi:hypothetical protein